MKSLLIVVFTCIIPLFYLCCTSKEGKLSELEKKLLKSKLESMQATASEYIENGNLLELFNSAAIPGKSSPFAYAMIITPDGEVLAHSEPKKALGILKDDVIKKVLEYRDSSKMLIQDVKYNNRNVLEFSLAVFSSASPSKYVGAVRLARYED